MVEIWFDDLQEFIPGKITDYLPNETECWIIYFPSDNTYSHVTTEELVRIFHILFLNFQHSKSNINPSTSPEKKQFYNKIYYNNLSPEKKTKKIKKTQKQKKEKIQTKPSFHDFEQNPTSAQSLFWDQVHPWKTNISCNIDDKEIQQEIQQQLSGNNPEIDHQQFNKILLKWNEWMNTDSISTCAICGIHNWGKIHQISIKDLSLLKVTQEKIDTYNQVSPQYQGVFNYYSCDNTFYHLHKTGLHENQQTVNVCNNCFTTLNNNKIPKYSLAAGFDFGNLENLGLPELNLFELEACILTRMYFKTVKLLPPSNLNEKASIEALLGHFAITLHNGPQVIADTFPRKDVKDAINVCFVGTQQQWSICKNAFQRSKSHILRLQPMLIWLKMWKELNPYYATIQLLEDTEANQNELDIISTQILENIEIIDNPMSICIEEHTTSDIAKVRAIASEEPFEQRTEVFQPMKEKVMNSPSINMLEDDNRLNSPWLVNIIVIDSMKSDATFTLPPQMKKSFQELAKHIWGKDAAYVTHGIRGKKQNDPFNCGVHVLLNEEILFDLFQTRGYLAGLINSFDDMQSFLETESTKTDINKYRELLKEIIYTETEEVFTDEEKARLEPQGWLNDTLINFLSKAFLKEFDLQDKIHVLNTHEWGLWNSPRQRLNENPKRLATFNTLLIPMHLSFNHWALGILELESCPILLEDDSSGIQFLEEMVFESFQEQKLKRTNLIASLEDIIQESEHTENTNFYSSFIQSTTDQVSSSDSSVHSIDETIIFDTSLEESKDDSFSDNPLWISDTSIDDFEDKTSRVLITDCDSENEESFIIEWPYSPTAIIQQGEPFPDLEEKPCLLTLESIFLTSIPTCSVVEETKRIFKQVKLAISDEEETIHITREEDLINEFTDNPTLFNGSFPHLFPLGLKLPTSGSISQEFAEHLLLQKDQRFAQSMPLLFLLFNQSQRHIAARNVSATLKSDSHLIQNFIELVATESFKKDLDEALANPTSKTASQLLKQILPLINVTGKSIPYGPIQKKQAITQLYALHRFFGPASWFVTLAPDDASSEMVLKLGNYQGDFILPIPLKFRHEFVSKNPVAATRYFMKIIEGFFTLCFGLAPTDKSRKTISWEEKECLLVGKPLGFFEVDEANGRGSLHFHSLLWGGILPILIQQLSEYPQYVTEIARILDSQTCCFVPTQFYEKYNEKLQEYIIQGSFPDRPLIQLPLWHLDEPEKFEVFIYDQAISKQKHKHAPTCHKGKHGMHGCRSNLPKTTGIDHTRPVELTKVMNENGTYKIEGTETISSYAFDRSQISFSEVPIPPIDPRVILWELKRISKDDGSMTEFSKWLLALTSSNEAFYPLFSLEESKIAGFYLTKYFSKDAVALTNILSLLYEAFNRVKAQPSVASNSGTKERTGQHMLTRLLNNLSGMIEVSAMQAASSLLGKSSTSCSHSFWYCFINQAVMHYFPPKQKSTDDLTQLYEPPSSQEKEQISEPFIESFLANSTMHGDIFNLEPDIQPEGVPVYTTSEGTLKAVPQHIHWKYRGTNLQNFSLFEYCGIIDVIKKPKEKQTTSKRGRKSNSWFLFCSEHPLYETHVQRIRSKLMIPILSGTPPPPYPGPKNPENSVWHKAAKKWARYYIILLLPHDVNLIEYSYEGLTTWMEESSKKASHTIDFARLNYLINCNQMMRVNKEQAEMRSIYKARSRTLWGQKSPLQEYPTPNQVVGPGYNPQNREDWNSQVKAQIEELRNKTDLNQENELKKAQKHLQKLEETVQKIMGAKTNPQRTSFQPTLHPFYKDNVDLVISNLTASKKTELTETLTPKQSTPLPILPNGHRLDHSLQDGTISVVPHSELNPVQNQAFVRILSALNSFIKWKHDPSHYSYVSPLFFIHGGPGVGKSYLAKKLHERLKEFQWNLSSAAPTGVAATLLVNASTIHSLFSIPFTWKKGPLQIVKGEKLVVKEKEFKLIDCLLLDELSMISASFLWAISERCKLFKGNNQPFGQIPIIMMGDFFQLPPAGGKPMYQSILEIFYDKKIPNPTSSDTLGAYLFVEFVKMDLTTQIRAAKDLIHINSISDMRDPEKQYPITKKFLNTLQVLSQQDLVKDPTWLEAPIVVRSNLETHTLNECRAKMFAQEHQTPLICWRYPIQSSLVTHMSKLEIDEIYLNNPELTGWFVQNAPGHLVDLNLNTSKKVTNGTMVTYHSLVLTNEDDRQLILSTQSGCQIHLNEPPYAIVVSLPNVNLLEWEADDSLVDGEIVIPLKMTSSRQTKFNKLHFTRHPVLFAFSMTYHKVQGKTLSKIILDFNSCNSKKLGKALSLPDIFVACTRVTTTQNMRILPLHSGNTLTFLEKLTHNPKLLLWISGFGQDGKWKSENIKTKTITSPKTTKKRKTSNNTINQANKRQKK